MLTGLGFLTGERYSTLDLQRRFSVVNALMVPELDIWFVDDVHGGVPANWLPFLRQYLVGTTPGKTEIPPPIPPLLPSMQQQQQQQQQQQSGVLASNRTAMVWMGWVHRTDALIDTEVAWFAARHDVLTASPTSHTLGPNGSLIALPLANGATHTPTSVWKQLRVRQLRHRF